VGKKVTDPGFFLTLDGKSGLVKCGGENAQHQTNTFANILARLMKKPSETTQANRLPAISTTY
jgi:hypothetical protein